LLCHFWKTDVEGFEQEVSLGINWTAFCPWTFCIETTLPTMKIPCYHKWKDIPDRSSENRSRSPIIMSNSD
jgi:hypothetical protein